MNIFPSDNNQISSEQNGSYSAFMVTSAKDVREILCEAYHILHKTGHPLAPETMWIENLFLNSDCISLFADKRGYLVFVQTITEERFNVSLPDQADSFTDLAFDCAKLYTYIPSGSCQTSNPSTNISPGSCQTSNPSTNISPDSCQNDPVSLHLQKDSDANCHSSYTLNLWKSDIRKLFENLKTPYYQHYANLLTLCRKHFKNQDICNQCLKDFYSVMIKSSPEKLSLIDRLADQICNYVKYPFLTESMIYDILIHHLALFGLEKDGWLDPLAYCILSLTSDSSSSATTQNLSAPAFGDISLLEEYLKLETVFLNHQESGPGDNISDYLTALSCWMSDQAAAVDSSVPSKNADTFNTSDKPDDSDGPDRSGNPENTDYPAISDKAGRSVISGLSGWFSKVGRKNRSKNEDMNGSAFLNQYAYNMNLRKYITNPAIGREQELADLELILISPKKSPILIGEAGVGKTSIVEGLAWLMQRGDIPDLLGDKIIYKLTTTSLLSGTKYVGEMEERMKALTDELIRHPEILLFIDEIHTIVGAGSTVSSHNDISNMLKPFIDRGDIKIIGATTREEYEHFLLPDRALARRFYPIQVEEPDQTMTMNILLGTIPSIEYETRVHSNLGREEMYRFLESLILISAAENQPADQQTRLPELPLSILEMAYSYAALHRRNFLEPEDFIRAVKHSNRLTKEARASYNGPALP